MLQAATQATQAALLQEQKWVGWGHSMPACTHVLDSHLIATWPVDHVRLIPWVQFVYLAAYEAGATSPCRLWGLMGYKHQGQADITRINSTSARTARHIANIAATLQVHCCNGSLSSCRLLQTCSPTCNVLREKASARSQPDPDACHESARNWGHGVQRRRSALCCSPACAIYTPVATAGSRARMHSACQTPRQWVWQMHGQLLLPAVRLDLHTAN